MSLMSLMSVIALILCVSFIKDIFFVAISLTTPYLSITTVALCVGFWEDNFVSSSARISLVNSASKITYSASFPSQYSVKCSLTAQQVAAAVLWFLICEPSKWTMIWVVDVLKSWIDWIYLYLSGII